jgi:hypothetical protein
LIHAEGKRRTGIRKEILRKEVGIKNLLIDLQKKHFQLF